MQGFPEHERIENYNENAVKREKNNFLEQKKQIHTERKN